MAIRNKTLIIGTGRLGTGLANRASSEGKDVIVIDPSSSSFFRLDDTFSGFKVTGDATDMYTLEHNCDIKRAEEVVIVTGDDNVNLFLAHVCSIVYHVPKIFVRFNDPDRGDLIKGLANVKAVYPFELSLNKIDEMEGEEGKK